MRQTRATWAIVAAVAVVVAAVVVFGVVRTYMHGPGGHQEHEGHSHNGGAPRKGGQDAGRELSGELIDGVRVVEMTAERYKFTPDPVRVRAGTPVRLEVTSTDVTHGIGIPEFEVNRTLRAEEPVTIEFTPEAPGEYPVHCSVYCGPGHGGMEGTLIVLEAE